MLATLRLIGWSDWSRDQVSTAVLCYHELTERLEEPNTSVGPLFIHLVGWPVGRRCSTSNDVFIIVEKSNPPDVGHKDSGINSEWTKRASTTSSLWTLSWFMVWFWLISWFGCFWYHWLSFTSLSYYLLICSTLVNFESLSNSTLEVCYNAVKNHLPSIFVAA